MLTRFPNWHWRLQQYMRGLALETFEWGVNDCALWAAGAIEAMTGVDPAADLRGRYSDAEGATELIHSRGWATLEDTAAELVAPPLASVLEARRGDLIWLPPASSRPDVAPIGMLGIFFMGYFYGPAIRQIPFEVLQRLGVVAFPVGERV